MKGLKITATNSSKSAPALANYATEIQNEQIDWENLKNIVDLTEKITRIRFYGGDFAEKTPSVLRCETCYNLLATRMNMKPKQDPRKVALKGIGKYSGSLSSGLILSPEKSELLVNGGNLSWYRMKHNIKQHLACGGEHSQLHFDALKHEATMKKRQARGDMVTQNLIRIALGVIKSKSAAQHFESQIAAHVSTGSDLGDFGHSRNHFNEIIAAMNVWIDRQTALFLSKPLESTSFPPHFFITADKSTPGRLSNQAVMICPMVNGERVAIPVNSPIVYSSKEGADIGDVSGATASELANQIIDTITKAFGSDCPDFNLKSSWQGTACDGQYQARPFGETLHQVLNVEIDPEFSAVIWDPSHWINLAILDIRDGKLGSSSKFLGKLVSRSKNIHTMFRRGKMLSSAIAIAQSKNVKLKLTQGNCATRFWSSQYQQFINIISSFAVYAEAFRQFGYCELKEYQILGSDFAIDLCSVTDAMEMFINLMVKVQGLAQPCWKICIWWPRLKRYLQKIEKADIRNPPKCLKNLSEHIGNILTQNQFKGQQLVDGWETVAQDEDVDQWEARDAEDCQQDYVHFVHDLIESMDARYETCVSSMCSLLKCFDLEEIFVLLCGERQRGKPVIKEIELEQFGNENFRKFMAHVCSLNHIRSAIQDGTLEMEPALSHVIYRKLKQTLKYLLWERKDVILHWFQLVTKKNDLKPLAPEIPSKTSVLQSFALSVPDPSLPSTLDVRFKMIFSGDEKEYVVHLNESAIYKSIYNDEEVYTKLGKEICLLIDIALAKGGPESVVESYYSVMKSQQQLGGQNNENLSLRAKLDWSLPNILQSERMIKEVANLYVHGDTGKGLKRHTIPVICDKNPYRRSKVLDRLEKTKARLPFLE